MSDYKNPKLLLDRATAQAGKVRWTSPSNLALIKYWGKHGVQLPRNPSISFTLKNAYTDTSIAYSVRTDKNEQLIDLDFYFEEQENEAFKVKIVKFLESILGIFPFLKQLKLEIRSSNTFPHSSGIASSASSMSALALCLCSMEQTLFGSPANDKEFWKKASYIARLGSGSACRSVYPFMAAWGHTTDIPNSSDLHAAPCADWIHENFKSFCDDILIVSKGEKSVSSRAGHALMEGNSYADVRYKQARLRMYQLVEALKKGDYERFGTITENEALTLHALMMTSNPSYILMEPASLSIIKKVQAWRKETGNPLYFSLDAGPNLHLLYPKNIKAAVSAFIKADLVQDCEDGFYIEDEVGFGPQKITD